MKSFWVNEDRGWEEMRGCVRAKRDDLYKKQPFSSVVGSNFLWSSPKYCDECLPQRDPCRASLRHSLRRVGDERLQALFSIALHLQLFWPALQYPLWPVKISAISGRISHVFRQSRGSHSWSDAWSMRRSSLYVFARRSLPNGSRSDLRDKIITNL